MVSNTIKDLAAGTAGGIAQVSDSIHLPRVTRMLNSLRPSQVLVGQPFDIVKVVSARSFSQ